jgi:oxaloacetate decarboxylase beta subunit
MNILDSLLAFWSQTGIVNFTWQQAVMILVGILLVYLAIKRGFEPLLLLPIGFGAILANIPVAHIAGPEGFLGIISTFGISNGLSLSIIFFPNN